jgi:Spy/CpxP family protein refolding chaperone
MGGRLLAAVFAATLGAGSVSAEPPPYAGLEGRGIKALPEAELADLLAGRGAGMALPAELNRYPGPKHALDLAGELGLTREQEAETRRLFERMQAEAVPLGEAVVGGEAELDRLFASGATDESMLRALVAEIARLRGELRFTHLKYHLAMRRLLSPEQVAAYDVARGYGTAPHDGRRGASGHGDGTHGGDMPTPAPLAPGATGTDDTGPAVPPPGIAGDPGLPEPGTREFGAAPLVPEIVTSNDVTAGGPAVLSDAEMGGFRWSVMRRTDLKTDPSTTLPRSEPEVMVEALPAVRAAQQDAGERGQDAPPDGGQARSRRRSGFGRDAGAFPPEPQVLQEGEASWHNRAWWCSPRQERPSKWSSPSSSFSCWCACSQTQRALISAARTSSGQSGGRLAR